MGTLTSWTAQYNRTLMYNGQLKTQFKNRCPGETACLVAVLLNFAT